MRRRLVVLLLSLSVLGVSAVPASARGGSQLHFKSGQQFRSFRHGFPIGTLQLHRHPFGHRAFRQPHSIIFFPSFVLPSSACEPVRIPGRWVRIRSEWVWATEHWGCR